MKLLQPNATARDAVHLLSDKFANVHWGQSAEDAILLRFIGFKRGGFYVDVGAHHPKRISNTYMFHHRLGWTGVNIDANREAIELFEKERPNDKNVHALIGERTETPHIFTIFKGKTRSTADANRTARLVGKEFEVLSQQPMSPTPLREILEQQVPKDQHIDFMNVDIEGFDIQALKTNDWSAFRPDFLCVEDFEFKTGRNSAIRKYMASIEYICVSHCYDTSIYKAS
ncbi:FkbM family methyltransferase [Rhizobiaceae bacterium n13]|uniref:FkbM family methyltransferase n=1 Tax=Ferirhizobium litorale TaxID=2927786 RepID=A0AAE3U523_9HYPH|nr:FkbM family methyltransferase [Fererhizobium litorale]MDI7862519.1 FkbM family methyltransferase [Fererhizobium litorale]MDI7923594.1 FkbM family methyltransferase [Fererhizobium litorale]